MMPIGGRVLSVLALAACAGCSASTAPWTSEGAPETTEEKGEELEIENKADEPLECPTDPIGVCAPGTSIPCYEGPPGTEGMGSCMAGKRHCNAHGSAYGTCEFQTLPNPYDCTEPTAFSCDAKLRACGMLQHAEVRPPRVKLIAFDGSTGFILGSFASSHIVIEHWADGQTIWSTGFEVANEEMPEIILRAIAVDHQGAAIVAVRMDEGSLTAGSSVVQGPAAAVLKLDPNGNFEWMRAFEGDQMKVNSVAVGIASNDIWLAGGFAGEYDFGTGVLNAVGVRDGVLLRLDALGTTLWSRSFGSVHSAELFGVAVDRNGHAFAGGWEREQGSACGGTSAVLASYDDHGQLVWQKLFPSALSSPSIAAVAIDPNEGVYVSGRIEPVAGDAEPISPPWAVDLGAAPATGSMFVAKYDAANGDHIWSRTASDSQTCVNMGGFVALDPAGNVMWAAQDHYSPRVRTFDANGHQLWERLLPTVGPEPTVYDDAIVVPAWGVNGFAVQPNGRFAIVGDFDGTIDFGEGPVDDSDGHGFFAVYDL